MNGQHMHAIEYFSQELYRKPLRQARHVEIRNVAAFHVAILH